MPKVVWTKVLDDDELYWNYEPKYLIRDIRQAEQVFNRKWKKIPTHIIFLEGTIIEYDGDLEVEFAKNVNKNHFKMVRRANNGNA